MAKVKTNIKTAKKPGKIKTLDDAKLLFEAGKACVGIKEYLQADPTTQPGDFAEDAQEAVTGIYNSGFMYNYTKILRRYNLKVEAEELLRDYKLLREIAGLEPH